MNKLKMLNIGCGKTYHSSWTNIDIVADSDEVIQMNILKGLEFPDNTYDVVYCSHVLEHLRPSKGEQFIKEMVRVLKPGGIIRVVVPDLETIARNYLKFKEKLDENYDTYIEANYDWSVIEMYDQVLRETSGGEMIKFMSNDKIINKDYVIQRMGWQAEQFYESLIPNQKLIDMCKDKKVAIFGAGTFGVNALEILKQNYIQVETFIDNNPLLKGTYINDVKVHSLEDIETDIFIIIASSWWKEIQKQLIDRGLKDEQDFMVFNDKNTITSPSMIDIKLKNAFEYLNKNLGEEYSRLFQKALFRNSGEVHYWMYDSFSLKRLLSKCGVVSSQVCEATESEILNFNSFNLDSIDGKTRKPDSLFVEGRKG